MVEVLAFGREERAPLLRPCSFGPGRPRRCAAVRDGLAREHHRDAHRDAPRRLRCWPGRRGEAVPCGNGGPLARLEQDARARLKECALTEAGRERIFACVALLREVVQGLGAGWSLELFGSMATGFGTFDSDVDATCFKSDAALEEEAEGLNAAALLKERLGPSLQAHPDFEVLEQILGARVPLLKLRFRGMLDIDLSCSNTEALQNTRLLRAYAQLDHRVRDLCILVKLWAKGSQVCGASDGHLSSYTFTLMAIYFMQVHLKLPCLPTSAFRDGRDGESARATYWNCRLSLADLVCQFFYFYNWDFQWCSEVVCVRLGIRCYATDDLFHLLRGRLTSRIHVEDPYRLERNLHCVLGCAEEMQLRTAFAEAWQSLQLGQVPCGLQPREAASQEGQEQRVEWTGEEPPAELPGDGEKAGDCEAAQPDGAMSEGSTASDAGAEWRSPCGSFSSDDEKSRGRSHSSDNEGRAPPEGLEEGARQDCDAGAWKAREGGQHAASEDESSQWHWWQHLESANVAKALKGSAAATEHGAAKSSSGAEKQSSRCFTVQELEHKMGEVGEKVSLPAPASHPFIAKATSRIAARVSKLCREHVRYQ